jgi:hypothetical protein
VPRVFEEDDSEIAEDQSAVRCDKDVLRLDVAMYNPWARFMQCGYSPYQRAEGSSAAIGLPLMSETKIVFLATVISNVWGKSTLPPPMPDQGTNLGSEPSVASHWRLFVVVLFK